MNAAQIRREQAARLNIVVVGMPGAGKSAIARLVALELGRPFVDLDQLVVAERGLSIPEIFAQEGEASFRRLETRVTLAAAAGQGQVIATGGGTLLRPENREALCRNGRLYHVRRDLDQLATAGRPLSSSRAALVAMEQARMPIYHSCSQVEVDGNNGQQQAAAAIVADFLALIK